MPGPTLDSNPRQALPHPVGARMTDRKRQAATDPRHDLCDLCTHRVRLDAERPELRLGRPSSGGSVARETRGEGHDEGRRAASQDS